MRCSKYLDSIGCMKIATKMPQLHKCGKTLWGRGSNRLKKKTLDWLQTKKQQNPKPGTQHSTKIRNSYVRDRLRYVTYHIFTDWQTFGSHHRSSTLTLLCGQKARPLSSPISFSAALSKTGQNGSATYCRSQKCWGSDPFTRYSLQVFI